MKVLVRPIPTLLVIAALGLSACGEQSVEQTLQAARDSLAKKDEASALIQLKSALQQKPELAEARYLLGRTLLDGGDPQAALVELQKARELGQTADDVAPPLARALLVTGQHAKLLAEFGTTQLTKPEPAADLTSSVAAAFALAGNIDKAQALTAQALTLVPEYPAALMLQARLAAEKRQYDLAIELVDRAIKAAPSNPSAWVQKGELLYVGKRDFTGSAEVLRKAIELDPKNLQARSALITALFRQGDNKAAATQIEALRSSHPGHPRTAFFQAQQAYQEEQPKKAKEHIEQALKATPDGDDVLQLAGMIQYSNGAFLESERHFSKALSLQPELPQVRRLLARTQIRMGEPQKAISTLQPLVAKNDIEPRTYALIGEAQNLLGNTGLASQAYATAVKLEPANSSNRVQLALIKQQTAGADATINELRQIASKDGGTTADLGLITVLIHNNRLDQALKAIDDMERKQADGSPVAANLRGRVHLLRHDLPAARQSFERALTIDPLYVPAADTLATMDLEANKPADAKKRYAPILKADPDNLQALLAMTKIRVVEKAPASETRQNLTEAIKRNPAAPAPRLLLIDHLLRQGEAKSALVSAQEAVVAIADQPDLVDALGRAQAAAGELQQAVSTFKRLAALEPRSTRPFVRLAGAHLETKNTTAAEQVLKQALALYPDYVPIQETMIKVALMEKRHQEALEIARTVQRQRPSAETGYELEAAIEAHRGNVEGVVTVFQKAFKQNPRGEFAAKLHAALLTTKKDKEAQELARAWLADHPKDIGFSAYLGDVAMARHQYDQAETHFRRVLAQQPDNGPALNNVAWTMAVQNKPGARAFIERALERQPQLPGLLDTLAAVLATEAQFDQAVATQRKAMALAPEDHTLQLNLAKIYLKANNKSAARAELQALAKLGNKFNAQAEVDRMLKAL